jgi:hypothetical protein
MEDLFFFSKLGLVLDLLGGDKLLTKRIHAVCNTMLVDAFGLTVDKISQRKFKSRDVFFQATWRRDQNWEQVGKRNETIRFLESRTFLFPWNAEAEACIC